LTPGSTVYKNTLPPSFARGAGVLIASPPAAVYDVYHEESRMPTVLRHGPYRFYFHSHETTEPPHIHVDRDNQTAKFWITPVALASSIGLSPRELRTLQLLVIEYRALFLEAWRGYFGS
jgi:hypothetical protein